MRGWLIAEDNDSITVLEGDLIPWTYAKHDSTTIPASWNPATVKLESVKELDAEAVFKHVVEEKVDPKAPNDSRAGPSYRALVAQAAWKKGMTQYCNALVAPDQKDKSFQKYRQAVLEDLAWLHYLRGVNLLMYADRGDVVKQLRLVEKIAPKSTYASSAKELADRLDKIIKQQGNKQDSQPDVSKLSDDEFAGWYISQLVDLRCVQLSQPGDIIPYSAIEGDRPSLTQPALMLKLMGIRPCRRY